MMQLKGKSHGFLLGLESLASKPLWTLSPRAIEGSMSGRSIRASFV
jgi:hypothetical protein